MRVFVYGTLCDPDTASVVLDEFEYAGSATLEGLHCVEGTYPTLAPGSEVAPQETSDGSDRRPGGAESSDRVNGRILVGDDVAPLDRYEGVDRGLYVRVSVSHADGGTVETYVGDPGPLDAPATWPGNGPFRDRVCRYVADNDVTVRSSACRC
jgi:hypothetical protein